MYKTLISIAAVILLIGATVFSINRYMAIKAQYKDLSSAYTLEQDNHIAYKRGADSLLQASIKPQVVSRETAEIIFKAELDAFKTREGTNTKNLESLLKTQIKGQNTYVFNSIDTAHCDSLYLTYSDKFYKLDINVKDGVAVVNTQSYTYLTKYTYKSRRYAKWYKPWKWGKDLKTTVISDNPKDSILDIKEIIINGH